LRIRPLATNPQRKRGVKTALFTVAVWARVPSPCRGERRLRPTHFSKSTGPGRGCDGVRSPGSVPRKGNPTGVDCRARRAAVKRILYEKSRIRSWRTVLFPERPWRGEQAFPQRPQVFSQSPRLALPLFTIFPPLLTFPGEPLRWYLRGGFSLEV